MMLTYARRREHCEAFFWMQDKWSVVVRCLECGRHFESPTAEVVNIYGKVVLTHCSSCDTLTCAPVLKNDHTRVAEVNA